MSDSVLLFHAGRQASKVRFLLYFSILCFVVALVAFIWIGFFGADPGMGAQDRWLLAFVVLGVGAAFLVGMLVYARLYVVWLWTDNDLRSLTIETIGLAGARERRFGVDECEQVSRESGEMRTYYHRLKTPYLKLRVKGQGLPYVIDLQGFIQDEPQFERLLSKIARA